MGRDPSPGPWRRSGSDWYGRPVDVELVINGETFELEVTPTTRLVDVLRGQLELTGTKDACCRGDCGTCTVMVGDRTVLACLTLASRIDDEVRTVEGMAVESARLRQSFADHGGLQCGYCTPGLIVRCSQLVDRGLDDAGIRSELAGNFCRCTGYRGVLTATTGILEPT